ncbi:acetyl-CoA carboxylase biotin carboxyl carrier protein [Variovorax sp. JS1663]|uniref:acetyl-CoA carboxylase biotin carboxyl carrier protein n=1 Tax=Variovorax sp. JS1663 TaxID=1851577 RepID=UPI000B348FCA|nr:biotin/lipoyl-containing protein [Variovorax sp. JS1663]OUM02788.1 acetyl-CoA carboxylase biotin carboxyl carrier protein subunit [Variovorax sp. JS1663]
MKSPEQVQELAAWLAATDIGLLELRTPGGVLRLGRTDGSAGGVVQLDAQDEDASHACTVAAPSVGVFLHAHPLLAVPLARLGERVSAGQPVGLVQIGPLLLPVNAPQSGVPIGLLVPNGQAVGFGTPLVELQPDE